MSKRHTFESWLILSALLFFSMGCVTLPSPPGGSTTVAASPTGILVVERVAPLSPDQCRLKVSLNEPPHGVDAYVFLTAEAGIRFTNTAGQESESITMTLNAGETREHEFMCQIDTGGIYLPGEYMVQAVALDRVRQNILYVAETKVPVSFEEGGLPRFAPSQESFDAQFSNGFTTGGGNIQYRLDLGQSAFPTGGFLLLKVVNQQDQAAVTVQASVLDGIQFGDPSAATTTVALVDGEQHTIRIHFGPIAPHGSRVARIPFRIQPGSMAGRYLLSVIEDNGVASWMETAPVLFRIERDATLLAEPWLASEQMAQAGPTQPAVLLGANVAAYQSTLPATATPVTAGPATPTPAATGVYPDLLPTAVPTVAPTPTSGAAVMQAMHVTWDQPLTAYYGSCRDVYNQRIAGKLLMSWEAFLAAVVQHNPDLAATNCMFDPFEHYWLPKAATVEASQ